MLIKCDYCGKEFERESFFKRNFCKDSHKVNFHRLRKNKTPILYYDKIKYVVPKISPSMLATKDNPPKVINLKKIWDRQEEKEIKTCKHGSMLGLCKYGCKN